MVNPILSMWNRNTIGSYGWRSITRFDDELKALRTERQNLLKEMNRSKIKSFQLPLKYSDWMLVRRKDCVAPAVMTARAVA